MKYIDAEKLIAEIERRKKEFFEIGGDTFENKWACGSLDNIKAFVISHQQEQPEVDLKMVVRIDNIVMTLLGEGYNSGYKTRPFYEEVLRRLNAKKD